MPMNNLAREAGEVGWMRLEMFEFKSRFSRVRVLRWELAALLVLYIVASFGALHPHPRVTALAKRIATAAPRDRVPVARPALRARLFGKARDVIRKSG